MPFINATVTKKLSENEISLLKTELGKIISIFPGKSEQWLMVAINDGVKMYFRGDDRAHSAIVEIKIFGKAPCDAYEKVTGAVCALFRDKLGISTDRVYVKYEECELWGWNGSNF